MSKPIIAHLRFGLASCLRQGYAPRLEMRRSSMYLHGARASAQVERDIAHFLQINETQLYI